MKIRDVLVGLLLLAVVGGGSYFAYRRLVLPSRQCDICGREIRSGHESTILLKSGSKLTACCPRCALHHEEHNAGQVEEVHQLGGQLLQDPLTYIIRFYHSATS